MEKHTRLQLPSLPISETEPIQSFLIYFPTLPSSSTVAQIFQHEMSLANDSNSVLRTRDNVKCKTTKLAKAKFPIEKLGKNEGTDVS